MQISERGIARPEIVERQIGAGTAQPIENFDGLFGIFHDQRFGDLETQRPLRHQIAAEDVPYLLNELGPEKLAARHVDADEQRPVRAWQLLLPDGGVAGGAHQHVRAELDDEFGFLRDRHEGRWVHHAVLGVIPADQRLESRQLLGREVDDRLIKHAQLVLLEGFPQIALDRHPVVADAAHLWPENLDPVDAAAFGPVHRDFGFLQEIVRVFLVAVVDRDADRAGEHDILAGDLDGRSQRAADALGQRRKICRRLLGRKQQRELVAADPRQSILRTNMALHAPRRGQQQAVADDEPERGVDALEFVDVDQEQRRADLVFRLGA